MNDEHNKYFEITDNLLPPQIQSISSTLKSFRMADEGETDDGGGSYSIQCYRKERGNQADRSPKLS